MLRSESRFGVAMLLICGLFFSSSAQMARVSDPELIGTADLIMTGTVKSVSALPNRPSWQTGQAIITIDTVLRGPKLDQVTVSYPVRPTLPPGERLTDAGGVRLTEGQQQLFFLQRAQGGYTIIGGAQGMRPVMDADTYFPKIQQYPLTVEMKAGPCCYFGKTFAVAGVITNTGQEPIKLQSVALDGFYYSARMGNTITFEVPMREASDASPMPITGYPPVTTGKSCKFFAPFRCDQPEDWRLLSPDTYVQTAAVLRLRVFVQQVGADGQVKGAGCYVASPWQTVMVGYAPPAEEPTANR
jgi:hypothetical protein